MNKQFFSDRPRLLTWISVLFALILAARLFSLQIIHGEDYSQSFEESVTRKIRIPAQRGRILDRNGTVLAESVPVRDITIVDKTGNSREENARLNTIIQNTLEILSRNDEEPENDFGIFWNGTEYEFSTSDWQMSTVIRIRPLCPMRKKKAVRKMSS